MISFSMETAAGEAMAKAYHDSGKPSKTKPKSDPKSSSEGGEGAKKSEGELAFLGLQRNDGKPDKKAEEDSGEKESESKSPEGKSQTCADEEDTERSKDKVRHLSRKLALCYTGGLISSNFEEGVGIK